MEEDPERDIDEIIQEMDYIPGHFHLELNLNFESFQGERLRRRDAKLKRESLQLEADDGAQRFAVRNLLGVFAFYLDEYPEAEGIFSSVCQEEPGNLNALANLGCVYDRLQKEAQAAECLERLSQLMAGGEGVETESLRPLRAARCLAEQAYASAFDVGLQSEEEHATKLSTAIRLYDKALLYGKNMITSEEKRSWYFTMAIMYIRLDGILMNEDPYASERLLFINKSLVLLRDVLKSDSAQYRALAWCYLGMTLERMDIFPDTPMAVHDCGFSGTDPLDCYGKAIETAKTDPFILNRLAKVFHFLGKQDMATGICNMALTILPDPGTNWQAYSTRAKINIKLYTQDLERVKMGHSGVPDRQLLNKAKADLDLILSVCPCLKTYLDMGQVCYYMGVDAVQELQLVDENALNNALVFFAKAMELDLGDTLPEIQLLRGKCLQVKGEEHNAEKSSEEMVIREVEIWVEKAEAKYQMERVRRELRSICRNHMPKILKLARAMIISGKLRIVKLLLETMNPDHT
ncbi:tetratricopeptide repeat protein 22 isoform X2 [Stegostoma tigrinum]|uniref:tetratricopeptide repeat protein 22 isoform X2 n=1 Tax=Stegostoma tigrinum TaxID=3053191 RepID=UPI0028709062|nr:tetratricopeptide repeat protein 22 isoform X2 [Stegostoma tigrinum]